MFTKHDFRWPPFWHSPVAFGVAWTLLICIHPTHAFGPTGHRVVGQIASNHLSPKAQKAVQEIMGRETLVQAATWPDEIRSDPQYHHGNWHFVTIEDGESYESSDRDPLQEDVITAIRLNQGVLEDDQATKEEKIIALRWLVHLVGDVHQPLHVGRGPDRGGNKIKVVWFGEENNIHVVWDEGLIESTKLSFSEIARLIDTESQETIAKWQNANIMDWVNESIEYRQRVYEEPEQPRYPGDKSGSYKYAAKNVPLVNQRMVQAGVRLAGLLNTIFADNRDEAVETVAVAKPDDSQPADGSMTELSDDKILSLGALGGTLYTQQAEEYRAISISAFRQAQRMLERGIAEKTWTALPEQESRDPYQQAVLAAMPPAIILDVDETVLDNSPYQAWLIQQGKTYSQVSWDLWVASAIAEPVPGAVEFIDFARTQGVTVFYVTNRNYKGDVDLNGNGSIEVDEKDHVLEPYTIKNLRAVGLLPQEGIEDGDSLLLNGEMPDWTSSKLSRRRSIGENFRVLLLVGDSIGDFTSYGDRAHYDFDRKTRREQLRKHDHRWAKSWIVIPNGVYGGWLPKTQPERLKWLQAWTGKLNNKQDKKPSKQQDKKQNEEPVPVSK